MQSILFGNQYSRSNLEWALNYGFRREMSTIMWITNKTGLTPKIIRMIHHKPFLLFAGIPTIYASFSISLAVLTCNFGVWSCIFRFLLDLLFFATFTWVLLLGIKTPFTLEERFREVALGLRKVSKNPVRDLQDLKATYSKLNLLLLPLLASCLYGFVDNLDSSTIQLLLRFQILETWNVNASAILFGTGLLMFSFLWFLLILAPLNWIKWTLREFESE
jgi:hypothetical protein